MYNVYNNSNQIIDAGLSFHVASRVAENADKANAANGPHYCKIA